MYILVIIMMIMIIIIIIIIMIDIGNEPTRLKISIVYIFNNIFHLYPVFILFFA